MGIRSLIAVMIDGEYKIAQYGKCSGQGLTALKFLQNANLEKFKQCCRNTNFLTKEENEKIHARYGSEFKKYYPQLSRESGAKILKMVYSGATILSNEISFAGNSLFCEYAYVIDFDLNTFEIYEGFNEDVVKNGRFKSNDKSLDKEGGYEPVKIVKSYELNNLPTEDEFLKYFDD